MALSSAGTLLQVGDGATPEKWADLGAVVEITGPGVAREMVEVTELADLGPDFLAGRVAPADLTMRLLWDPDDATHTALYTRLAAGTPGNYRLCFPNFTLSFDATVNAGDETVDTGIDHGFQTGQPIRLTATAMPASMPQVVAGTTYYYRVTDTFDGTLHLTAADAVANANIIGFTTAGTAVKLWSGDWWVLPARVAHIDPAVRRGEAVEVSVTLRLTGAVVPGSGPA